MTKDPTGEIFQCINNENVFFSILSPKKLKFHIFSEIALLIVDLNITGCQALNTCSLVPDPGCV